jgi:hypothetical protein
MDRKVVQKIKGSPILCAVQRGMVRLWVLMDTTHQPIASVRNQGLTMNYITGARTIKNILCVRNHNYFRREFFHNPP